MKIQTTPMRKARIEIIPMIDTIFFLLVFFMYSSLSMVRMKGIQVALPKGPGPSAVSPLATPTSPATFIVTVTDTGDYYVNTTRVAPAALGSALQSSVAAAPKGVVVLNVAKTQTTQTLIDVYDSVNKVSTPSGDPVPVLIATEPMDTSGHALP